MSKLKLVFNCTNIFLKKFNFTIRKVRNLNQEIFESLLFVKNNLLRNPNSKLYFDFFNYLLSNIHLSFSQRFQDIFVDWIYTTACIYRFQDIKNYRFYIFFDILYLKIYYIY
jgi:hypothetical protein